MCFKIRTTPQQDSIAVIIIIVIVIIVVIISVNSTAQLELERFIFFSSHTLKQG